jgi:hypothetical protein
MVTIGWQQKHFLWTYIAKFHIHNISNIPYVYPLFVFQKMHNKLRNLEYK